MPRFAPPLTRRTVLAGSLATASAWTLAAPVRAGVLAEAVDSARSPAFEAALAKILAGRTPEDGKIRLELPEFAENGNTVPYKIEADSPMTADDYVKSLHLLSTGNPQAAVASFHLTPLSGKAAVSGRMRLARSQDVVVLAETSTGALLIGTIAIKVTIGGCGNE